MIPNGPDTAWVTMCVLAKLSYDGKIQPNTPSQKRAEYDSSPIAKGEVFMTQAVKFLAGAALGLAALLAPASVGSTLAQATQNLKIYWIDVEGGAATLIVSPAGESLLLDTGYPDGDRDAKRSRFYVGPVHVASPRHFLRGFQSRIVRLPLFSPR